VLCGFWLFGMLKIKTRACIFSNTIEVMAKVKAIFSKIRPEEFTLIIDKWKCRLRECIDRRGEYIQIGQFSSPGLVHMVYEWVLNKLREEFVSAFKYANFL
jgi:hypothetical protein